MEVNGARIFSFLEIILEPSDFVSDKSEIPVSPFFGANLPINELLPFVDLVRLRTLIRYRTFL